MATLKQVLLSQLSSSRITTYSDWLDLGLHLMETCGDPIVQFMYKKLSGQFREQARLAGELYPGQASPEATQLMLDKEKLLIDGGWK